MTRFEDCFPPDIVRAVYARLEREEMLRREDPRPVDSNVISFSEYRRKAMVEEQQVVS
ncbi:hypothetical protein J3P71_17750 [Rhizobium leguminosarum]|uniref:hypothetical protein n=1 Tax=Rhizobium leguminosarum TaxID=384 RepID=UPI001441AECD|nr:hypothetical protein [Rhizobium leguminosarum]MBY5838076.1 hypothetical protein [Rhizobium leguminosarum]QSZ06713.1 hypothetical protein J3P71_17750 [Rhizobium leguminosarum]